jgi:hypothetical protein
VNNITKTLNEYGAGAVQALKNDVSRISATGDTADSIRYEVKSDDDSDKLTIFGRAFFSTIESGRGPRQSSTDHGFKDKMLDYMKAKGIGANLTEKKREQLAKFLVYRINKEGDKTFKQGGRIVYSPTLDKLVAELRKELTKDFVQFSLNEIRKATNIKKAA